MVLGADRSRTRRLTDAIARPFVALRVPPNVLTVATLVPALATAWLLWLQAWFWAVAAGLVTGLADTVDGAVARARGRTSPFGGWLDSVVDRYVDGIILLGIGLALDRPDAWVAVGAGLLGSFGTSYARARAYQETHAVPPETWGQWMERAERLILLALGALGQGIAQARGLDWEIMFWTLVVFAVATNLAVLARARAVHRLLRGPRPGAP